MILNYVGGVAGQCAGVGLRKLDQRPTYVKHEEWEVCVYRRQPHRILERRSV
ncbi:hypothetical protein G6O69_29580 [Pseudenhygromyxa sp. WMMC2535]|uniref:hypothetical protein n=1 Tax=Pseudenhygromyxa sp. WMMC2535 TaxID=2712867 RepID=UPI0015951384|nr:hypothetical protein [Pseudenhygromyxa sp. WMMC2535]NVB42014.1 hypothetical protein [Pseudenhygromyxa sp. WMMC2535]